MKISLLLIVYFTINLLAGCDCHDVYVDDSYRIYIKSTDTTYRIQQLYFVEPNYSHKGNNGYPVNTFILPAYQNQLTIVASGTRGDIDTLILSIDYQSKARENSCGDIIFSYQYKGFYITKHSFLNANIKPGDYNPNFADTIIITP